MQIMTYNAYNFTNILFNESISNSVYWVNSELVISLLIIITLCQIINIAFKILDYIKSR